MVPTACLTPVVTQRACSTAVMPEGGGNVHFYYYYFSSNTDPLNWKKKYIKIHVQIHTIFSSKPSTRCAPTTQLAFRLKKKKKHAAVLHVLCAVRNYISILLLLLFFYHYNRRKLSYTHPHTHARERKQKRNTKIAIGHRYFFVLRTRYSFRPLFPAHAHVQAFLILNLWVKQERRDGGNNNVNNPKTVERDVGFLRQFRPKNGIQFLYTYFFRSIRWRSLSCL